MTTSTGWPWVDLLVAIVGSGTGSFLLGFYAGHRYGRRRRAPAGRHQLEE